MPITNSKYEFNSYNIDHYATSGKGVYGLYDSYNNVIYYGKSDHNVKDRLKSHLSGAEGPCTKSAYYFTDLGIY
jgi:hypothetical protein